MKTTQLAASALALASISSAVSIHSTAPDNTCGNRDPWYNESLCTPPSVSICDQNDVV